MEHVLLKLSSLYDDEEWSDGAELDLRDIEGTNAYCSDDAAEAICEAIKDQPLGTVHWIDSGDYHYLSALWLRKAQEPFSLALYDNHSDEQETAFGGILSCGSWVSEVKRNNPWMREDSDGVPAYVSIDLDVLSQDWARTNWDQGNMSLDELCDSIRELASRRRILGIDVCGGKTASKGGDPEDYMINRRTQERLLELFSELGF